MKTIYGSHEYKNHKNGHGIEIWECRQCGYPMNNIKTKSLKKTICDSCYTENRMLKERMRHFSNKVMKVLHP